MHTAYFLTQFHTLIVTLCELVQLVLGQKWQVFVLHSIFFGVSFYLTCQSKVYELAIAACLLWEAVETGSWLTISSGVTRQVINSVTEFDYIFSKSEWVKALWIIGGFALAYLTTIRILRAKRAPGRVRFTYWFQCVNFWIVLFYHVIQEQIHVLRDINLDPLRGTKADNSLEKMFSPPESVYPKNGKRKSLIVIQLESFEQYSIGLYNEIWKETTPFFNDLINRSLTFDGLTGQLPFTTWTSAGIMTTQCAMPLLSSTLEERNLELWDKLLCVPAFLNALGYKLVATYGGSGMWWGIKSFFLRRNFTYVGRPRRLGRISMLDRDMFTNVLERVLPNLLRSPDPFYLRIMTEDTHVPYALDKRCTHRGLLPKKKYPKYFRALNCLDENVEIFLTKLQEMIQGRDDIEVIMHGDHINHVPPKGAPVRKQLVNFPFRQGGRTPRNGSLYDVPDTIMDVLGLDYKPKFFYGSSLFGNQEGRIPTEKEHDEIWRIVKRNASLN